MVSLVKEGYGVENLKNLFYTLQKIHKEVQFWLVTPRSLTGRQELLEHILSPPSGFFWV